MKSRTEIQAALKGHLKKRLEFDMQLRTQAAHSPVYGIVYDGDDTPQSVDKHFVELELLGARSRLIHRLYDHERNYIDELTEDYGIPTEQREEFAHGLFETDVVFWEVVLRRTLGEFPQFSEITTRLWPDAAVAAESSIEPGMTSGPGAPADAKRFSEVIPAYIEFMMGHEGWRGQTKAQNSATFRMFQAHCGDKPVAAYARRDLASFYDVLRQLPALYSKKSEWKDMALAEIVAATKDLDIERMTMKTVKRHFSALGGFFTYLKKRGEYVGENPAHGFDFPEKTRANKRRMMWEGEKLTALFASPVWAGCKSADRRSVPGSCIIKDEKYWLPLLGLYHGNRLEEFAQLRREDVKSGESVAFFDINDEGDKQLKNEQSRRRVPIHPVVLAHGFMGYLEEVAPQKHDKVFPNLRPGGPDNKLGFYFTKWFSQYRKDIGIYERRLDYHSFRHGVTTKLYAAGVQEALVDELTGHEGGGISRSVYKKEMPLRVLLEAISKVEWPEVELR